MMRYLFHFTLCFVVFNDGLRLVFKSLQSFTNRLFVIVHAAARFSSCEKPLVHRFGRALEVQNKLATRDLFGQTKDTCY